MVGRRGGGGERGVISAVLVSATSLTHSDESSRSLCARHRIDISIVSVVQIGELT